MMFQNSFTSSETSFFLYLDCLNNLVSHVINCDIYKLLQS